MKDTAGSILSLFLSFKIENAIIVFKVRYSMPELFKMDLIASNK